MMDFILNKIRQNMRGKNEGALIVNKKLDIINDIQASKQSQTDQNSGEWLRNLGIYLIVVFIISQIKSNFVKV